MNSFQCPFYTKRRKRCKNRINAKYYEWVPYSREAVGCLLHENLGGTLNSLWVKEIHLWLKARDKKRIRGE